MTGGVVAGAMNGAGAQPAPMTAERERQLLVQIPTLATVAEAQSFRAALRDNGEVLTTAIYADLIARIDLLQKRGCLA